MDDQARIPVAGAFKRFFNLLRGDFYSSPFARVGIVMTWTGYRLTSVQFP
jgi:hypothetical protein